jgi:Protein of unknown function (DUF3987)
MNGYILDVLRHLYVPDQVVELRCLNTEKGTVSGYFNDHFKLANAADKLDNARVPAIYVTLNQVNPVLLARAQNRIISYAKQTTSDADIIRRRWLPIDLDPVRATGISSSQEEHAAALSRAGDINLWLRGNFGFPDGTLADSGNGAHLLYRIDMPNDADSRALSDSVLRALHEKFSDDKVKVDLTTFNAARIWKLYGTTARKGDATDARPHRMAQIIHYGDGGIVGIDLLEKVANLAPKPKCVNNNDGATYQRFDLDSFLAQHAVAVKRDMPWNGAERRLVLEVCPWNADHTNGSAYIVQFEDGAIAGGCHHNGCVDKGWPELRELFDPDYKRRKQANALGRQIIDNIIGGNGHIQRDTRHEIDTQHHDFIVDGHVSRVTCHPEESVQSDVIKPFPESAWSGLFGEWRKMIQPCTEASLESIWSAFLLAAGMVIGQKVWRYTPRAIYPNFYILLIGQTGDSRKSTVLWLASELLRHAGEEVELLEGVVSSEGLIEALAKHDGTKALVFADEFRGLLAVAHRKGTQDLIPRFNSLYYCPEKSSVNRVKNPTTAVRPFQSIITATPQEYIEDILGELEIAGGFLNRCLIITGEEQPPKPVVKTPDDDVWAEQAMKLCKACEKASSGHMEFDADALSLWNKFYVEWKTERRQMRAKDAQLTARTFEHILKIAIVYTVLAEEVTISKETLKTAIKIGGWLQSNTTRLFAATGLDRLGRCEHLILDMLLRAKEQRMWRRDLQRAVGSRGYNGEMFGRALRSLEFSERVYCSEETTLAGRTRTLVEYVKIHETRDRNATQ